MKSKGYKKLTIQSKTLDKTFYLKQMSKGAMLQAPGGTEGFFN